MRGRKPLPSHLHVIKGTATAETQEGVSYTPVTEFPSPPRHLNVDGAELWNTMGRELTACGALQVVDLYALGQLAYMWQRHMEKARKNEEISATENIALKSLLSEFGATPSSRRRVGSAGDDGSAKKNPFKKFGQ